MTQKAFIYSFINLRGYEEFISSIEGGGAKRGHTLLITTSDNSIDAAKVTFPAIIVGRVSEYSKIGFEALLKDFLFKSLRFNLLVRAVTVANDGRIIAYDVDGKPVLCSYPFAISAGNRLLAR